MLNGKFFTGLPANMMDRRGGGAAGGEVKNRLESHFFWPDDSKAESVVETRLKRRNSLQYEQHEKPRVQQQISVDQPDVDTKGMFQKEFAKSSIHFYDNIPELPETVTRTKLPLSKTKRLQQDIAPKPTATKLKLPETIIDEEYTNAKKQQVYASKIQFYDYTDDELNATSRNNARKPKIDMNDKKTVERNSKNSPKLQVKRNVRELREIADMPELKVRNDYERDINRMPMENSINSRYETEMQNNTGRLKGNIYGYYNNNRSAPFYTEAPPNANRKSIKPATPNNRNFKNTDVDLYTPEMEHISDNMANVRIKPQAKKHVTYQEDFTVVEQQRILHNEDEPKAVRVVSPIQRPIRRPITSNEEYLEPTYDNNNANKNYYNNNAIPNIQPLRKPSPKLSTSRTPTTMTAPDTADANAQKHLRSNIFLNDYATPTSHQQQQQQHRRSNVRSSAVQRVSVGLPD